MYNVYILPDILVPYCNIPLISLHKCVEKLHIWGFEVWQGLGIEGIVRLQNYNLFTPCRIVDFSR